MNSLLMAAEVWRKGNDIVVSLSTFMYCTLLPSPDKSVVFKTSSARRVSFNVLPPFSSNILSISFWCNVVAFKRRCWSGTRNLSVWNLTSRSAGKQVFKCRWVAANFSERNCLRNMRLVSMLPSSLWGPGAAGCHSSSQTIDGDSLRNHWIGWTRDSL